VLFLTVLRTSRHPQSASMLLQGYANPFALELAFRAFSILVELIIATSVYRRKCLNTYLSKYIFV